ncbi:MAG: lamin tail domain-containing protein, partial [Bacteroidetes bacterium]|nr:lamin tail domain-containing protein [Bacteroidota bacterium]
YNSKDEPVNIGGLFLSDDSNNPTLWQIPDSLPGETTIPPKSFITLWADGQTSQGVLHFPAILNAGGGDIFLSEAIGPDIETTDSVSYPGLGSDVSYGRYPDGSSQFKSFSPPTNGSANILPFITGVYINEFLAGNSITNTDEAGEYDDWIELYNAGSSPVDVGGLFITDNLADANPYQIPTTDPLLTTIPPNGFLLLWADRQMSQGVLHVDIKLSGGGEQIGLIQINGDSTLFIDSLTFGPQVDDISRGRNGDGAPDFVSFTTPTPNATNETVTQTVPFVNNIFINEFMASNTVTIADPAGSYDDWIELYNAGSDPVDVGGLYITDDLTDPTAYRIPATDPSLTTIPPNGFLLLWADSEMAQGVLHVDIKLSAGGEQIGLVQLNGDSIHFIDSLTFGPQMDDTSSGRTVDGGPLFTTFPVPTPNATNVQSGIHVVSYTLIDANSDVDLFTITNNMNINFSMIDGMGLNIRANTYPEVVG